MGSEMCIRDRAVFVLIFGAWSFATTTHEEEGEESHSEEEAALVEVIQ